MHKSTTAALADGLMSPAAEEVIAAKLTPLLAARGGRRYGAHTTG